MSPMSNNRNLDDESIQVISCSQLETQSESQIYEIEQGGSGIENISDDFGVSLKNIRNRHNSSTSHHQLSFFGNLSVKISNWWSSVFRRNGNNRPEFNIRFEDQEVELIKGVKNGVCGGDKKIIEYDETKEYINFGEEDQMEIQGYERSEFKTGLTWIFIIATIGLLRLVFHWWPQLMLFATHKPCHISKAQKILVTEHYQQKYRRYHVKPVFDLSTELFRTQDFFSSRLHDNETPAAAAAPGKGESDVGNNSWNAQLQEALKSKSSLKLAVPNSDGTISETSNIRFFSCKKLRYIWKDDRGAFLKLPGFDHAITSNLHKSSGLSTFEQCQRRLIYGNNEIKVEVQGIVKLLFLEVLNPFYVFQIFSVSLWLSDNYHWYATAIIIMSMFGITSTIIQTRQNQKKLQTTVQSSDIVTVSRGNGIFESIPTEYLVPGDLILIPPHGCTMHCDAALLVGSCIVNESMLTGESVPVTKSALPNRSDVQYDSKEHSRHTLFCGTHVMQTRYYGNEKVLAVVLRSGFLTAKGSLVRSIMYPPPVDYKFENDSYKFVAVLACVAGIGFVNSVFTKVAHGETIRNIIVDSLDLITIVVPPALPAAMTVGRFYAQRRLQKQGVYCISPRAINVSGSIDCVCFDKTGTLTEEGLDLWGVVPLKHTTGKSKPAFGEPIREGGLLSNGSLMVGMAACHSLTRIDGELIGDPLDLKMFEWVGWTLEEPGVADNEKFDILAPTIVRPKREVNHNVREGVKNTEIGGEEVGIIRQFPFSSSLQRMSVITRTLGDSEYEVYCKGSPEMISSLAIPNSIPKNFASTLEMYTQEGYRVIAVGHRRLPKLNYAKVQRVMREELEIDLTFLGLIVMENRLKPETTGVMTILKNAAIRTIMVTGDNLLTAISVAKECEMLEATDKIIVLSAADSDSKDRIPKVQYTVANKMRPKEIGSSNLLTQSPQISMLSGNSGSDFDKPYLDDIESGSGGKNRYHFALTGYVFGIIRTHYPELLSKILVRGTVFARMSPEQKQLLVELLQGLGYFVGMCGDGSNDCGALKAAHAGISLSDTESSVAAPFTSLQPNITCVPHLIREGRGALVTSFGIFKYMAVYSLTQFSSVIILYHIESNITDIQFLYIDLFLISVFAFFFGNSEPNPGPLVKTPPSASLVSAPPILSILLHMLSIVGFQTLTLLYTQSQPWFTPYVHPPIQKPPPETTLEEYEGYENYALFTITCFQYIIMAIVFSRGKPHRRSIWHNPGLLSSLILLTAFTIYLVLIPCSWLRASFVLNMLPPVFNFQLTLLGFAGAQFLLALTIEFLIVDWVLNKKIRKWIENKGKEKSKKEYIRIEYELSRKCDWPPISNTPSVDSVYISNENDNNGKDVINDSSLLQLPPSTHPNLSFQQEEMKNFSASASLPRPRPRNRTLSSNSYNPPSIGSYFNQSEIKD